MCAQSPYNMRGLLLSSVVLLVIATAGVDALLDSYFLNSICTQPWCPLVSYSIQLALLIFGFLLFCAVARWYKLRVRDDDYSPYRGGLRLGLSTLCPQKIPLCYPTMLPNIPYYASCLHLLSSNQISKLMFM